MRSENKSYNLWSHLIRRGKEIFLSSENKIPRLKHELAEEMSELPLSLTRVEKVISSIEEALIANAYEVRRLHFRAVSEASIGASGTFGKIPFEIGLSFDPILNVPYIPGSSIKGAVSSAFYEFCSSADKERERTRIFGGKLVDETSMGLVGFTDAYPTRLTKSGILFSSVFTPHYSMVKTSNELDVSPNPILHFMIPRGTEFASYMFFRKKRGKNFELKGSNKDISEDPRPDINSLGDIDKAVLYAFIKGIGSKTTLGYSRFEILEYSRVR